MFDPELLAENLRCKIIYYSCINPATISDLNRAWGYSSPTYLYQNDSLEKLKAADLITVEQQDGRNIIRSNYAALFEQNNLNRSQEQVNHEILREFLIQSKGFQPKREHRQDETDLLGIARGNLDAEAEDNLRRLEFDSADFATLTALWQDAVFREAFLSLEITASLFGDRKGDLPDNPVNYLFRLTAGVMDAIRRGRSENRTVIPPGLTYRAEQIIVPSYRVLNRVAEDDEETYAAFVSHMKNAYSLFRTKFREDRFHYEFIHDFVNVALQDAGEKKFGKLFRKYRGDSLF